ncbi:MAG: N-acetyltransferase family protein [Vulcanimicrobiota bacterium]
MDYRLEALSEEDRVPVTDIFNFFIDNSFAVYPEERVPPQFFDNILRLCQGYPALAVKDGEGKVVGFALMRPFMMSLKRAGDLSYFILPEHSGKGIGRMILELFTSEAGRLGVDTFVAGISSLNEGSLRFHEKMGFSRCGLFTRVGNKRGMDFDVIYMQKMLQ